MIPSAYLQTASGDEMLLWDSKYTPHLRRSFLFGTQDNLSALAAAPHLVIDGTFKVAPSMFTQLLTAHGILDDGWMIPCGLLPGKMEILYTNLLEELDIWAPSILRPETIIIIIIANLTATFLI